MIQGLAQNIAERSVADESGGASGWAGCVGSH
jgi:hypothetical protein